MAIAPLPLQDPIDAPLAAPTRPSSRRMSMSAGPPGFKIRVKEFKLAHRVPDDAYFRAEMERYDTSHTKTHQTGGTFQHVRIGLVRVNGG
jgi:hypothetical protein